MRFTGDKLFNDETESPVVAVGLVEVEDGLFAGFVDDPDGPWFASGPLVSIGSLCPGDPFEAGDLSLGESIGPLGSGPFSAIKSAGMPLIFRVRQTSKNSWSSPSGMSFLSITPL